MAEPLNVRERDVFDMVAQAAASSARCPSNIELCNALDLAAPNYACKLIANLERKGWIEVERFQTSRCVTILSTGQQTAGGGGNPHWRQQRPGFYRKPRQSAAVAAGTAPKPHVGRAEVALPPVVHRDPCFRCGTRGDVGCRHTQRNAHA